MLVKRLLTRVSAIAALCAGLAAGAAAAPISPDLKKVVEEAEKPGIYLAPSRAGWDGPEARTAGTQANPTLESLRPQPAIQWLNVAVPDWRMAAVAFVTILALRRIREEREAEKQPRATVLTLPTPEGMERAA